LLELVSLHPTHVAFARGCFSSGGSGGYNVTDYPVSRRESGEPLEIGWRVRRDKWRQGLAFEAAERMVTFAFETLEANLLCAVCHPENIASVAVMKKLGMRFRSVEEWYSANDLTFEITRNEWRMRAGSSARVAQ